MPAPDIDLTALTDEEWEAHKVAYDAERDRRYVRAQIPEEVGALARRYADSGGDRAVLVAAIEGDPDQGE